MIYFLLVLTQDDKMTFLSDTSCYIRAIDTIFRMHNENIFTVRNELRKESELYGLIDIEDYLQLLKSDISKIDVVNKLIDILKKTEDRYKRISDVYDAWYKYSDAHISKISLCHILKDIYPDTINLFKYDSDTAVYISISNIFNCYNIFEDKKNPKKNIETYFKEYIIWYRLTTYISKNDISNVVKILKDAEKDNILLISDVLFLAKSEKMVYLLAKYGAPLDAEPTDINNMDWAKTALHYLVMCGRIGAVKGMLKLGAKIDIPNINGNTVIDICDIYYKSWSEDKKKNKRYLVYQRIHDLLYEAYMKRLLYQLAPCTHNSVLQIVYQKYKNKL